MRNVEREVAKGKAAEIENAELRKELRGSKDEIRRLEEALAQMENSHASEAISILTGRREAEAMLVAQLVEANKRIRELEGISEAQPSPAEIQGKWLKLMNSLANTALLLMHIMVVERDALLLRARLWLWSCRAVGHTAGSQERNVILDQAGFAKLPAVSWEWQDSAHAWQPYDEAATAELEMAVGGNVKKVELQLGRKSVLVWISSRKQVNVLTQESNPVRRRVPVLKYQTWEPGTALCVPDVSGASFRAQAGGLQRTP